MRFNFGAIYLKMHGPNELGLCRRRSGLQLSFLARSKTDGGGVMERCSDNANGRHAAIETTEA